MGFRKCCCTLPKGAASLFAIVLLLGFEPCFVKGQADQCGAAVEGVVCPESTDIIGINNALNEAARVGDLNAVKEALACGANVEGPSAIVPGVFDAPLAFAVNFNQLEVVEFLICMGANIDKLGTTNQPNLWNAAVRGFTDIALALINGGGNVDIVFSRRRENSIIAASAEGFTEIVQALADAGALLDEKNLFFETALGLAIKGCHSQTVQVLLEAGADQSVGIGLPEQTVQQVLQESSCDLKTKTEIQLSLFLNDEPL